MEQEELFREFEKRERLVQTFLLIGGFVLTITDDKLKPGISGIFSAYLLFIMLYYVFISRTKMSMLVDFLAFISSYIYSLFILIYFNSLDNMGMSPYRFLTSFAVLTLTITYSLLSPDTSNRMSIWFENFFMRQEKENPNSVRAVFGIVVILALYTLYSVYLAL